VSGVASCCKELAGDQEIRNVNCITAGVGVGYIGCPAKSAKSTSRHNFIAAAQTSIVSGDRKSRKVTEMSDQVDYSLYLVTDSTDAILGSRDLVDVVEKALQGGRLHIPFSLFHLMTGIML
jgi:hypothetical protein